MRERRFIFSADQEKLPARTRVAFGRCCPLQPLPLAGGIRRRVGVVAYVKRKKKQTSPWSESTSLSLPDLPPLAAGLLSLSRLQRCWFPVVANVCGR